MKLWRDLSKPEQDYLIKWKCKRLKKKFKNKEIRKDHAIMELFLANYPILGDVVIWFRNKNDKIKVLERKKFKWKTNKQ